MAEVKLNFLLMGKTGHGKSATGNTLLNRKIFISSANTSSVTNDVDFSFALLEENLLMVVDGPGLEDTGMNKAEDKERVIRIMSKALAMCNGGVDAFLFVIKFGIRFTDEEKSALDSLKRVFGDGYLDHVIVVVTHGTAFYEAMEEERRCLSFPEWCREQSGKFRRLYDDCQGRFVLFDNREKDHVKINAQRKEIVNHAVALKNTRGPYQAECFKRAKIERERLIVELRAPELKQDIQEKVSLVVEEIEKLSEASSEHYRETIRDRISALKVEIDTQDRGFGLLTELRELVETVEQNLDNKIELIQIGLQLETNRKAKKVWGVLGTVCTFAGAGLALVAAPVVAAGAAVGAVAAGVVGEAVLHSNENKLKDRQKKLEKK